MTIMLGRARIVALLAWAAPLAGQGPSDDAPPVALPDGVTVDASIEYYDLDAADLRGVVDMLNRMRLEGPGGRPSQGLTRYWISPNWRVQAGGGECRVVHVDVSVEILITLPRWRVVRGRPVEEQEGWERIESAIREHEFVHRDLAIEAAGELREEMSGLRARGCGTLRDVVSSTLSIVNGRLEQAHADFDRDTPPRLSIRPGGG